MEALTTKAREVRESQPEQNLDVKSSWQVKFPKQSLSTLQGYLKQVPVLDFLKLKIIKLLLIEISFSYHLQS